MIFSIDGYFKDEKDQPFEGYLVKDDHTVDEDSDDDIFFYGLSERSIIDMIKVGEETPHDFVITAYSKD